MYKRIKRAKLGRKKSHRDSLIRNLLRSLFENNHVLTTTAKAKVLKQEASSLIAKGGSMTLNFRRELLNILGKESLLKKYEEYVGKDKKGVGIVKVGFQAGDNAELSRVYLLGLEKKSESSKKEEEKKDKKEKKVVMEKKKPSADKDKRVDKTAVIHRTERARSRAGI